MILTKEVEITINRLNIEHLLSLGYENITQNHRLVIPIEHLQRGSGIRIDAKCDTCDNLINIQYYKYIYNWNRSKSYNCKSCSNITFRKTFLEKYGVDNPSKLKEVNLKRRKTCLEKYGVEYVTQEQSVIDKRNKTFDLKYGGHPMKTYIRYLSVAKINQTKLERGLIIEDSLLSEWDLYRKLVRKLTERNRSFLLDSWNGFDYYDNEYIKNNFTYKHTDAQYPTLDHKLSIIYGFQNDIIPDKIADMENLCMTKKSNNSSKANLTAEEYINKKAHS